MPLGKTYPGTISDTFDPLPSVPPNYCTIELPGDSEVVPVFLDTLGDTVYLTDGDIDIAFVVERVVEQRGTVTVTLVKE